MSSPVYEEKPEESEETEFIKGDDHYAKFHRFLARMWRKLSPNEYKKVIKDIMEVFYDDDQINAFIFHLALYLDEEISRRSNHKIRVDYTPIYSDISSSYFTSYVTVELGGKERDVQVANAEIVKKLRIASSRKEFNELIEDFIKHTIEEADKVVQDVDMLKKCKCA